MARVAQKNRGKLNPRNSQTGSGRILIYRILSEFNLSHFIAIFLRSKVTFTIFLFKCSSHYRDYVLCGASSYLFKFFKDFHLAIQSSFNF